MIYLAMLEVKYLRPLTLILVPASKCRFYLYLPNRQHILWHRYWNNNTSSMDELMSDHRDPTPAMHKYDVNVLCSDVRFFFLYAYKLILLSARIGTSMKC